MAAKAAVRDQKGPVSEETEGRLPALHPMYHALMCPPGPVSINTDRFLFLVASIAAAGCAEQRAAGTPAETVETATVLPASSPPPHALLFEPSPSSTPPVPSPVAPESLVAPSGCDNDKGSVDCTRIAAHEKGPSCEGLTGTCKLLAGGYGYRPRVAESIAKCYEQLGPHACSIHGRKQCNRKGIQDACADPQFEPACRAILDRCAREKVRIGFTLEECVKTASALDKGNRDWALGAMGPSREGCRLMFPVY